MPARRRWRWHRSLSRHERPHRTPKRARTAHEQFVAEHFAQTAVQARLRTFGIAIIWAIHQVYMPDAPRAFRAFLPGWNARCETATV